MGRSRKKRGTQGSRSREWDDWQRYIKQETQRIRQKSSGQVVEVKFAGKKTPRPPEKQPVEEAAIPVPVPEETEGRRPPVPGVPREEALQVSDDEIGRTVKPYTVDDYRNIRPMSSPDLFDSDEESETGIIEPPAVEADGVPSLDKPLQADSGTTDSASPAVESISEAIVETPPPDEVPKTKPGKKTKKRKGRKKKAGDSELELFDSVSDHQVIARQRLTKKSKLDREDLIEKLLDPVISLEEAATLIGVCKTTVRRYTNKGELECLRTPGQQRRFRLSHVLAFVKNREEDQKVRRSRKAKG